MPRSIESDESWQDVANEWSLRPGTIYLNHGSFGPPPAGVQKTRQRWQHRLDSNPMDFFVRELEHELTSVRQTLGAFVGTDGENLILVDNATYAMNVIAASFSLGEGDEVLLTNHTYGAVRRIWQRQCEQAGAALATARLPAIIESVDQIVDAFTAAVTPKTRLLVVSHITSPTALTLPVGEITKQMHQCGVAVCIDGPHAVAQLPLAIDDLNCDFYAASCHKWLNAPFGTGFLYVHPRKQADMRPPILSWGRLDRPDSESRWTDEFTWLGTRDPSGHLAIPAAIDFLRNIGLDDFRVRTHYLAQYARCALMEFAPRDPILPDDPAWYGSMAHVPLPDGDARKLQTALWEQHGIEVPVIDFEGKRWIRVSCHLYTNKSHIDRLASALRSLLKR